ncbi:TPA: hypothetical protein MO340_004194 [Salmonella enterica subsp. salamae serovar 35:g,m,s,t:-]|nr:hypothetical protein [Salmonella enterica subsp. salamae serovar 35:g,m,s,t:-]HCA3549666.1 hypothetical protein [Salmonella enterica subsp. salamae serovar 35:g,m,s,t:-]
MLNNNEKMRFEQRIKGELLVSADVYISMNVSESAVELRITEPALYERISQYAERYGEDLQGLFQTKKYQYMSCFIYDAIAFEEEFKNENALKPLFSHGKGETVEFLVSFPEIVNFDDESQN